MLYRVVSLWVAFFAAVSAVFVDSSLWENTRYYRTVDLSRPYIKEQDLLEVKNTSPVPQQLYVFTVNDGFGAIGNVSFLFVDLIDLNINVQPVQLQPNVYSIDLPYPISPGSLMELKVHYVYANSILPYPFQINLADTQTMMLRLNKFCYSPYTTHEYSLTLTGFSKGQEMDLQLIDDVATPDLPQLKARVEKEALLLAFGPIKLTVPSYAIQPVGFLYDHNRPITRAVRLDRAFWLPASDVDVVQTEDYYELVNDGAELKSGFSRSEWMLGRYELMNHFALSQLEFPIDPKAPFTDYYFTDKVGMVTSHKQTKSRLVLQPRFPLFGGWKYNFTMGWTNHLESLVHRMNDEKDTFVAQLPLLSSLRNVYYDKVSISFYLPENAEYISAAAIVASSEAELGTEKSYLDVSDGHVKVTLHFENLFDDMSETKVYVKYKYSAQSYWRKVARISAFVFLGFLSYYALTLVDVSIKK